MNEHVFEYEDADGDKVSVSAGGNVLDVITGGDNHHVLLPLNEVIKLRAGLDAFIAANEPRSYTVGLPVIVTVHPNGRVEYDVDTAEAGAAVDESKYEYAEGKTMDDLEADVRAIDIDHERRMSNRSLVSLQERVSK